MKLSNGLIINEPITFLGNIEFTGEYFPSMHECDYEQYSFRFNSHTISCDTLEEAEKIRKDIELSNGGTNQDYIVAEFIKTVAPEKASNTTLLSKIKELLFCS
jgi:hypothetical protein